MTSAIIRIFFYNCTTYIRTSTFCSVLARSETTQTVINLINNTAFLSGSAIFYNNLDNIQLYNRSMSNPTSIFYVPENFPTIPNASESLVLATQPRKLVLSGSAKCSENFAACNVTGITLGEEIKIPAAISGYSDQPAEAATFLLTRIDKHNNLSVTNELIILLKGTLHEISVTGNEIYNNNYLIL